MNIAHNALRTFFVTAHKGLTTLKEHFFYSLNLKCMQCVDEMK